MIIGGLMNTFSAIPGGNNLIALTLQHQTNQAQGFQVVVNNEYLFCHSRPFFDKPDSV
jgi:hypothetical protein